MKNNMTAKKPVIYPLNQKWGETDEEILKQIDELSDYVREQIVSFINGFISLLDIRVTELRLRSEKESKLIKDIIENANIRELEHIKSVLINSRNNYEKRN